MHRIAAAVLLPLVLAVPATSPSPAADGSFATGYGRKGTSYEIS